MTDQPPKRKQSVVAPLVLSVAAVAGLGLALMNVGESSLTMAKLHEKVLLPLIRLLCYLAVGLLVGQAVESLGWTVKLARWMGPLTRWGHLKEDSSAAFAASFVSGIVANTLLMGAHQEGRIGRRELLLAYVVNNGLPMYLVHLPSTLFIVMSLAGSAGLMYLAVTFVAACARSLGALVYARLSLEASPYRAAASVSTQEESGTTVVKAILSKFRDRFVRLLAYTLPIYVLVFLINDWGLFQWLRKVAAHLVAVEFFPVEAAGVVVFAFAAEFSSGMAAAGALLDTGTLTAKQAALSLVAGSIVSTPIRAVRHQLPTHAGIFSLSLGSELLFLGQGLRVVSLAVVAVVYAVLF